MRSQGWVRSLYKRRHKHNTCHSACEHSSCQLLPSRCSQYKKSLIASECLSSSSHPSQLSQSSLIQLTDQNTGSVSVMTNTDTHSTTPSRPAVHPSPPLPRSPLQPKYPHHHPHQQQPMQQQHRNEMQASTGSAVVLNGDVKNKDSSTIHLFGAPSQGMFLVSRSLHAQAE